MNDLNARAMVLRAKTHTVQPLEAYDDAGQMTSYAKGITAVILSFIFPIF